ncbi:MAG: Acid sugar phosphatase [Fimbriimonadaceae bacterium]|nr:Acid sugar phosphatase [Fimbriimonadaceae bacterium]
MRSFQLYIFDLDGTLYRGLEVIPEALSCVQALARRGSQVAYLSNNSGSTPSQLGDRLRSMGYPVVERSVWNSGIGTAQHLRQQGKTNVFVLGEPGLFETLQDHGLTTINSAADPLRYVGAEAVVVGICRTATYQWIDAAMQAIRSGADFVACNPDPVYPLEGGRLQPGAGTLVAAVRTCSEREPVLIGKPEPKLIEQIMEEFGVEDQRVLVVGDREDTDMEAARRAGVVGALVKSGEDYRDILEF